MSDLYKNRPAPIPAPEANFSQSRSVHPPSVDLGSVGVPPEEAASKARTCPHPLIMAMMFGLAALALLLPGIGTPPRMYFDEPYFVPEARAFIQGKPNPTPDAPPLAKPP